MVISKAEPSKMGQDRLCSGGGTREAQLPAVLGPDEFIKDVFNLETAVE
jgi:hypothetical protein